MLRAEIATLQQKLLASDQPRNPEVDGMDPRVANLQAELERERALRVVEQRKAKYPELVAAGISDDIFTAGDEASLARLKTLVENPPVTDGSALIAPTSPKRAAPAEAKAFKDKTKEELLDDLRRVSPAYQAWQNEQRR